MSQEVKTLAKQPIPYAAPLVLLGIMLLLAHSSLPRGYIGRDSGVFLYEAQQLLDGGIPYRDTWDHKGPLIYYIDALGLLLGRGSPIGVWLLECTSLSLATILGLSSLTRAFGRIPAYAGSVAWLLSLGYVLEGGNLTEEFALPFQFLAIQCLLSAEQRKAYGWRGSVIGLTLAACILLKPSLVGVQLSLIAYISLTRVSQRQLLLLLIDLASIFSATALVLLVVQVYFAAFNAWPDLVDQVLRYNLLYSAIQTGGGIALWHRVAVVANGLTVVSPSGASLAAVMAWLAGVMSLWRINSEKQETKALVHVALIAMPVECVLVSLSGRTYGHYYIEWLPVMAVLTGFLVYSICGGASASSRFPQPLRDLGAIWSLAFSATVALLPLQSVLPSLLPAAMALPRALSDVSYYDTTSPQLVPFIRQSTSDSDYVLIWGAETSLNFLTQRRSPTRYAYQYALYTRGYQDRKMVQEYLRDISLYRPRLIVDTSATNSSIPPIDTNRRIVWMKQSAPFSEFRSQLRPEMADVFNYINEHYSLLEQPGKQKWDIYEYVGNS